MEKMEYIKREIAIMKEDCEKLKISPAEWIERYADEYHRLHSTEFTSSDQASNIDQN